MTKREMAAYLDVDKKTLYVKIYLVAKNDQVLKIYAFSHKNI